MFRSTPGLNMALKLLSPLGFVPANVYTFPMIKRCIYDHLVKVTKSQTVKFRWFLGVADTNDVIQKIEKTLNNTHTTTQKLTNNSFRNTKKHPKFQNTTITICHCCFLVRIRATKCLLNITGIDESREERNNEMNYEKLLG